MLTTTVRTMTFVCIICAVHIICTDKETMLPAHSVIFQFSL